MPNITLKQALKGVHDALNSRIKGVESGVASVLGETQDSTVSSTIFGWLKSIRDFLVGIVTTNPYAKESTLGSSSDSSSSNTIFGKLAAILAAFNNINIDTTSLAQRTDVKDGNDTAIGMLKDATNGLVAIKGEAASAATDAAAAKVAAQGLAPVAQAAEAYNIGKVQLAANITAKGVQASASETLPELAQKVTAIAQQPIILSPSEVGDMYAVQQFGSLTTPNYWNLYEVLANLLSDGRLNNYGGILLAEYYKGYDSIALDGAGAGGAYVVSDVDSNGNFIMYTEDTTHTWATDFDGKGNRWVAYCFADESHDFQITDTNTSPRSIHIGRHVGVLSLLTSSRCAEIVVTDGNLLDDIRGNYTQKFNGKVVLRNINNHSSGALLYNPTNVESVYIQAKAISSNIFYLQSQNTNIPVVIIESDYMMGQLGRSPNSNNLGINTLVLKGNIPDFAIMRTGVQWAANEKMHIVVEKSEYVRLRWDESNITSSNGSDIYFGYETNDKTKSISLVSVFNVNTGWNQLGNIILQDGWNKPINVNLAQQLTEANIYANILQRLKQDEPDCGDGVTITLGATNLAKLTSQESIDLLDALTNTYGYTFA